MQTAIPVATPLRSHEQRMDALRDANAVRSYRADLKRHWHAGTAQRSAMDVLSDPTPLEESWKVFDIVMALPKVGRVKTNRLFRQEGISPSKTVGGLSDRQRNVLVRALWALPSVRGGIVVS